MREVAGLGYDEIATACGLTPDAVRSRIHRARLQLRDRLSTPDCIEAGIADAPVRSHRHERDSKRHVASKQRRERSERWQPRGCPPPLAEIGGRPATARSRRSARKAGRAEAEGPRASRGGPRRAKGKIMTDTHGVISAFLDDESFDATELAAALSDPAGGPCSSTWWRSVTSSSRTSRAQPQQPERFAPDGGRSSRRRRCSSRLPAAMSSATGATPSRRRIPPAPTRVVQETTWQVLPTGGGR